MFDATNSKPVDGQIEIVDAERARLIQKTKATDTLFLPDPKSKSGIVSFITDVFGYRKVQFEINYKEPVVDSTKHYIDHYMDFDGDFYVVQFEMVRYHKGDIATLYNVFFFNDAAIMMPQSKYELNKLLELMNSNPKYRIKLHGHTNGNSHGKIISMGPSKDFFNPNAPDVKVGKGTAKALSGERAEVIREWLIAQGISGDRIEVKAWGGHRMIHDRNSVNAKRNVRVEVEVLSD
jgi:outer membrane protein OmpA-like peptidoglycan-associated protein